ncbi:MAG: hypothetical protein ABII68_07770 [Pseudomonadota bacterium]
MSLVTFMKTEDRTAGVQSSLKAFPGNPIKGKNVLIKPNFNTADPTPGSTHNDTLAALVDEIRKSMRPSRRTLWLWTVSMPSWTAALQRARERKGMLIFNLFNVMKRL